MIIGPAEDGEKRGGRGTDRVVGVSEKCSEWITGVKLPLTDSQAL